MALSVLPFRAGSRPGEYPAGAQYLDPATLADAFSTEITLAADVSEFNPNIADAVYAQFSQAIIFRAMYGTRVDNAWFGGQRRKFLHQAGMQFIGMYQYITAFEDVLAQADALSRLIGALQHGELVIADIEEGSGSQQERWVTWADRINANLGFPPWDYSGLNFAATHGLQPVDWVAAYGQSEPGVPHKLWQLTDHFFIPGVGTADCSLFHGPIGALAALTFQGHQPSPPPPTPKETDMPSGTITEAGGTYPVSFPRGSVKKVVFYAQDPATADLRIAHSGPPASLFDVGMLNVSPRAAYTIEHPDDVDAIVIENVTGSVAWHTE